MSVLVRLGMSEVHCLPPLLVLLSSVYLCAIGTPLDGLALLPHSTSNQPALLLLLLMVVTAADPAAEPTTGV